MLTKEEFEESLKQNGFEQKDIDAERKRFFFSIFVLCKPGLYGVSSICPASEFVHEMDGLSLNFGSLSTDGQVDGLQTAVFVRGGPV